MRINNKAYITYRSKAYNIILKKACILALLFIS